MSVTDLKPRRYFDGEEILWKFERFAEAYEASLFDEKPFAFRQHDAGWQDKGFLQPVEKWHQVEQMNVNGGGVRQLP